MRGWMLLALSGCGAAAEGGAPALTEHGATGDAASGSTGSAATRADSSGGPSTTTDSGSTSADDSGTSTSEGSSESGESTGTAPQSCAVVSIEGTCDPVTRCPAGSTAFGGDVCDGPPTLQCCVPEETSCSVGGAPGLCLDVTACASPNVATPGLCPGASNIQCCTDPATACDPELMPTPNAGLEEESWDAACPLGMVTVEGFCIDRFEASLVELGADGTELGSWSPFHNPGTRRVRAVSLRGAVPQGYISGDQAADACAEAGKRLCDDDEWLRACQGSAGTTYPYGDEPQPGVCNDARDDHPVIEYFGTSEEWIWSELGNACISQIPDSLDTTGENPGCVSEDGAFDMMGNLHEWTSDPTGTFRGGFYVDTVINMPGCLYRTTAHTTPHWDYSTGFRCCA